MPELKLIPFLKGEDLPIPTKIRFLSPHEDKMQSINGQNKELAEILVELPNGEKRNWTMNKASQRSLQAQLGTNSDHWIGKEITVYSLEQNVLGQIKKVIYVQNELNKPKI